MRRQDTSAWTGRKTADPRLWESRMADPASRVATPKREHVPYRDALTNLPNRFLLADRLRQAMLQSQRRRQGLAVAYLDLDGVNVIGEVYGSGVRDELLLSVAQRMKQVMRDGDTLARLNRDEFVAVLVDLGTPQACRPVLDRLTSVASDAVSCWQCVSECQGKNRNYIVPQGVVDVDLLLRHAEQAFSRSDAHGRVRYQMFDIDLSEMEYGMMSEPVVAKTF